MIDLRNLRNDPEGVIKAIGRRGEGREALDEVIKLDIQQREVAAQRDEPSNFKALHTGSESGLESASTGVRLPVSSGWTHHRR